MAVRGRHWSYSGVGVGAGVPRALLFGSGGYMESGRSSSNRRRRNATRTSGKRFVIAIFATLLALSAHRGLAQDAAQPASSPVNVEPESAGPEFREATDDQQLELLRRLLGVQAPEVEPVAAPEPAAEPEAAPAPQPAPAPAVKPAPKPAPKPAAKPAPAPKPVVKPAAKPAPAPKPVVKPAPAPKPVVKPAPKPAPVVKPAPKPAPKPAIKPAPRPAPKPAPVRRPAPEPVEVQKPAGPTPAELEAAAAAREREARDKEAARRAEAEDRWRGKSLRVSATDLPEPGTRINASNVERWTHLLSPSVRWAVRRGAPIEVVEAQPIVMEPFRAEATERYHAQVELAPDAKSMLNYVAGVPFPYATIEDPNAAIKMMFNYENRIMFDDVDGRNFGCITGATSPTEGVQVERDYRLGHFRRLFFTGRLRVDPKPTWDTPDRIRYRESLSPILEPFDLKGAGFTYNRYLDAARQDDSWLYFPQTRRVRRLSTAQRSEAALVTSRLRYFARRRGAEPLATPRDHGHRGQRGADALTRHRALLRDPAGALIAPHAFAYGDQARPTTPRARAPSSQR